MESALDKRAVLKQYFGYDAFRPGQEALIDALLAGRDVLCVMPTGAGKSICYQLPALLASGVTIVVSPLISLMNDQVMALKRAGVRAAYLNTSLRPDQCETVLQRAADGWYQIVYVAPERLDSAGFLRFAQAQRIASVIVDEAHCISQWGQDFRPSYLKIADFIAQLPARPPVGAFTATATLRVRQDIEKRLGLIAPLSVSTGFDRPNLFFSVSKNADKLKALRTFLQGRRGKSGIVYCATRKNVESVCAALCSDGIDATRYHAGLSDGERRANQDDFQSDAKPVMVATNAFGMGIDKPNVSFVVHYNMPMSIESYYQEAGRAGRDGKDAICLLLYSREDVRTAQWLIRHGRENPDLTDAERRQAERRDIEKLGEMEAYATSGHCLRSQILCYFGEAADDDCENCGNCRFRAPRRSTRASAPGKRQRAPLAQSADSAHSLPTRRATPAWTSETDAQLRALCARRASVSEIMAALGRTLTEVSEHLQRLSR